MITSIKLSDYTGKELVQVHYLVVENELKPPEIWNQIKKAYSNIKYNTDKDNLLSLRNELRDTYKYNIVYDINNNQVDYMYLIELNWEDSIISIHAYHKENYKQKIECLNDRLITHPEKNEGNCIDDFIKRGVESRLDIINELVISIKNRLPERQSSIQYHDTWCYEKDFTQISLIKKEAEKIVANCNKQLERISDKYTKLSY